MQTHGERVCHTELLRCVPTFFYHTKEVPRRENGESKAECIL